MQKLSKVLAILIILILFFVPTIIALKYATISMLYSHFVNSISNLTGINTYLVKAAVALLFIPFLIGIKFLFSINKSRRQIGTAILATLVITYNLSLFFLTKDLFFAFGEGKVLKWYALTPDGVKFFDKSGVEPVYGITLKPVTPEVIRNLKLLQKGEFKPVDPGAVQFFNPITGEPQVWYFKYPDGVFDFFDKPGYHPITGEPLKPVSKEIYFEWKESNSKIKEEVIRKSGRELSIPNTTTVTRTNTRLDDFNSTINSGKRISSSRKAVTLVVQGDGSTEYLFPSLLKEGNFSLVNDYFKNTFKTKGYFNQVYSGETTLLKQSNALSKLDYLILGKINYSCKKSASIDNDLFSCNITLSYKILDKNANVIESNVLTSIGPGFSEELALKRGLEILAEKFSTNLNKIL